jgi:hypothetical protein
LWQGTLATRFFAGGSGGRDEFGFAAEINIPDDSPNVAEIVDSNGISSERMGVGGKANEIKGPVAPQDKSNAEDFEFFLPVTHFASRN